MTSVSYAAESVLLIERFLRHFVKVVIVRRQKIFSQMNII